MHIKITISPYLIRIAIIKKIIKILVRLWKKETYMLSLGMQNDQQIQNIVSWFLKILKIGEFYQCSNKFPFGIVSKII